MPGDGATAERLQQYLRALSPQAHALLTRELERGVLQGNDIPGNNLILQALRGMLRDAEHPQPRIGNAVRLFFKMFEPFIVDDVAEHKHPGRIARGALEPLWTWIKRDLAPGRTKAFSDEVGQALLDNDEARAETLTARVSGRDR